MDSLQIVKDKQLRLILIVGFLLRVIPMLIWQKWGCVRDGCTYLRIADRMVEGHGMTSSNGWLWAPGYPALIALHEQLFSYGNTIRITQVLVSVVITVLVFRLGSRMGGRRTGLWAAGLYAFSPTMIFFSQSLWSECLYSGLLLLAVYCYDRAKSTDTMMLRWACVVGVLVGICVLFRGVATYMLPIFGVALLWSRMREWVAWKQVFVMFLAAGCIVAPYSIYATNKFETFIVSDKTIGQMMWMGNNDFEPMTFDWGNGQLSGVAYKRHKEHGRNNCPANPCSKKALKKNIFSSACRGGTEAKIKRLNEWAIEREECQLKEGVSWIKSNPETFVSRMPMRVAQMVNPHSFLTRHLRSGKWPGLPQFVDEVLILCNVLFSFAVLWGGTAVLCLRGKGGRGLLIGGVLLYHVAAISLLAGLTRYRVPLEPLLMLYLAWGIADWQGTKKIASEQRWRLALLCVVMLFLIPLTLWFFPTGWSWWRHW